jgi:hypothetical protein
MPIESQAFYLAIVFRFKHAAVIIDVKSVKQHFTFEHLDGWLLESTNF